MVLFIVMWGCSWHTSFPSMLLLVVCELGDPHSIFSVSKGAYWTFAASYLLVQVNEGSLQFLD
jgi:hypothetical protein